MSRVPRTPSPRLSTGLAALCAAAAVTVALIWRNAPSAGDSFSYVVAAEHLPHSNWTPVGYGRYGLTLPVRVLYHFFGFSVMTEMAYPVLATAVLAAAAYLLGQRVGGPLAGIAAAALTVGNDVVFPLTTRLYPDMISTAVVAVALLLALVVRDRCGGAREDTLSGARLAVVLVAIGLLLGLSYEVRETSVFAWPVVAWVLLRSLSWRRLVLPVVLPIVGWIAVELVIDAIGHHDPFVRERALIAPDVRGNGHPADQLYLGKSRWHYLSLVPRAWVHNPASRWLLVAGAIALLGGLVFRRRVGVYTWWFLLSLVPLLLAGGVVSPDNASLLLNISRYWSAFVIPMVLVAVGVSSGALAWIRDRLPPWRWSSSALVAGIATVCLCAWPVAAFAQWLPKDLDAAPNGGMTFGQLRSYFTAHPPGETPVWSTVGTANVMRFYERGPFGGQRWQAQLRTFDQLNGPARTPGPQPGDYIVEIASRACTLCAVGQEGWTYPTAKRTASWQLVWQSTPGLISVFRAGR